MTSLSKWTRRPVVVPGILAAVLTGIGGCGGDARTDGRFWRQPTQKPGLRPTAAQIGVYGDTATYSVGPGFTVSGDWPESGGARTARGGQTAVYGVWRERNATTGDVFDPQRYGVTGESRTYPSVYGGTMQSGAYSESAMQSGVER